MADNQYRRYLEDNNQESHNGVLGIAAVGLGATLALSPRARAFTRETLGTAGRIAGTASLRMASYLHESPMVGGMLGKTMDILRTVDKGLDQRNPISLMFNGQGMERRMSQEYAFRRELRDRKSQSVFGGTPLEITKNFEQLTHDLSMGARMYERSIQQRLVLQDIEKKLPSHWQNNLGGILSNQRQEFFSDPQKAKIENLLDRYSKKNQIKNNNAFIIDIPENDHKGRQQFIDTMFKSLQNYSDSKVIEKEAFKFGGTFEDIKMQGSKNMAKTIKDGFIEKNQTKGTWLSKVMGSVGARPMLVRDALEQDASGKWINKLLDNDRSLFKRMGGNRKDANLGDRLAHMANRDERFLDLALDHRVFIDASGKIVDTRGIHEGVYNTLSSIQRNIQVPFLKFNPLDLAHWTTYQAIKEAPATYFLRQGTIQPILKGVAEEFPHPKLHNQDAAVGPLAREYMYNSNKVMDVITGEVVKDDVYLASARFGAIARSLGSIANLHTGAAEGRGAIKRLFDVGGQESETIFNRMLSTFTKFNDPNWARNRYKAIFSQDSSLTHEDMMASVESSYKDLYAELSSRSTPLSDDTINFLNKHVKQAYGSSDVDLLKMRDHDEIMGTLGRISAGFREKNSRLTDPNKLSEQIGKEWSFFTRNPQEYLKNKRIVSDNAMYMMGPAEVFDPHKVDLVSKADDVKRLIHQHAIEQIEADGKVSVGQLIKEGIQNGELSRESLQEVRDLATLSRMNRYWNDVYIQGPSAKEAALSGFRKDLMTDDAFRTLLEDAVERHSPVLSMGPGDKPPQPFGFVNNVVINKARGGRWALENYNEQIQAGVNPLKAGVKSAIDVISQPFAGRKNMGDFTTASMVGYYFAERLDNSLARVGLGLSQKNRGSMQSIILNQFGRRIVLPYVAMQQLMYFDGLTNDFVSDKAADTYANMTMDVGWLKDITGLNSIGKEFSELFPGSDQLWKTPIGGALKYGTFGFLGDTRNDDELRKYYESGEDPVRKGRWWGIGSTTPWEGGKIDRYVPNWYRRLKSDYKFTDTMYGSEEEYWANNWMPTLTHPFAPIRHFITDPNHYAKKHEEDRPYPITGGINELEMIPLIGPVVNRTLGGILNPYHENKDLSKAHLQYQEDLNNYITSQYQNATGGGIIQFMPAGGYNLMSPGASFGGGFGEGLSSLTASVEEGGYGSGVGGDGGISTVNDVSKADLTAINMGIIGGGGMSMSPTRPISSLDSLRDADTVADLRDLASPYSNSNVAADVWYNLTETAGIYGFSANMFAGIDTNVRSQALDRSSRMMSYNRSFWDNELGGADGIFRGDFSEIFRRYVARDPRKQYYNPLKNQMPDWMPGLNYFIDFQHGDPYTKVPKGELRLPGAAYESLNQLHPDQYGDYGAFDRFKILADVAPYSDEYKYWRRQVSQMKQAGLLTAAMDDEYREVRDQVSEKKKKYHFYPNKFRNAKVDKEEVTITKVLDANTFLTAEHPDNPIRLAGVHVKSDAADAQEFLQQYIYEGAKVTIGVDADPLFRVRDDTMNTMHAVVYSSGNDENPWYASTKGQSVNAMLARRKFKKPDEVTLTGEDSGVATAAMYDSSQITVGKINEWIAHDLLPNVPILGTITDKFMPVRTPLETYKKTEVYGKAWRPWTDPWGGWIEPMLDTASSKNPLVAAAQGYGIGWLTGKAGVGRYYGKWIGAAIFGSLAAVRSIDEYAGNKLSSSKEGYAWIPERRKTEREINEYFDILKYMKYKGLYEKAAQQAKEEEGVDISALMTENEDRGHKNKQVRKYLDTAKKWLSIAKKSGYVDEDVINEELTNVRDRLNLIDTDRPNVAIGPKAMLALQYKEQYESTLYGADPNGDMTKIFRALPNKDREFFTQFMTASPSEREEILRLVPKDQRRFYQAKWGMDVDDKPQLSAYFREHYLPSANWEGWQADVSLDDIKLKVVRNEGLELTDFGMWGDDVKRADASGVDRVDPFKPSMMIDTSRIEKVLRGAGLTDVSINMTTSPTQGENRIHIAMDYIKDRTEEIKQELSNNLGGIFG